MFPHEASIKKALPWDTALGLSKGVMGTSRLNSFKTLSSNRALGPDTLSQILCGVSDSFSNFWQLAFGSLGYLCKRTILANVPMNSDVADKNKSWKQWWNSSIKDSLAYLKFVLGNSYVEVPCGQHPEREEAQGLMCVCWTPGSGGTKINKPQDLPSSNSHSSRGDWRKSKHSSKIINWNLYKHSSSEEDGVIYLKALLE